MIPPLNLQFITLSYINSNLQLADWPTILGSVIAIVLFILSSALFSGSENALFSLNKTQIEELTEDTSNTSNAIKYLINFSLVLVFS